MLQTKLRYFRMGRTYEKSKTKLTFQAIEAIEDALVAVVVHVGGVEKRGRAPAGGLERQIKQQLRIRSGAADSDDEDE